MADFQVSLDLIPVRGLKHRRNLFNELIMQCFIRPNPRKGTETIRHGRFPLCKCLVSLDLIPVRGLKQASILLTIF